MNPRTGVFYRCLSVLILALPTTLVLRASKALQAVVDKLKGASPDILTPPKGRTLNMLEIKLDDSAFRADLAALYRRLGTTPVMQSIGMEMESRISYSV